MDTRKYQHMLRGRYIRFLRLKRNWLQIDLADRIDISKSYMCDIERGSSINIDTEQKIADALGIERWQLAKVPAGINKRLPWMDKKEAELKKNGREYRKLNGIKGRMPVELPQPHGTE